MTDNVQEMVPLLDPIMRAIPQPAVLAAGAAGASLGGLLWLFGSRFSRSALTLMLVTVGASVGLRAPQWLSLPIGNWATAVAGALVLGVWGYVMHRLWVGIGLALLNGFWAAVFVATSYGLGDWLTQPGPTPGAGLLEYGRQAWESLPEEVRRVAPMVCGLALSSGLTVAILWPRLACCLFHSLLGTTLVLAVGASALDLVRPEALGLVPAQRTAQLGTLTALVLFGAVAQWRMSPRPVVEAKAPAVEPLDE